MHTLIENNTFIKTDKYNTHQEDSFGWFKYINPILTLQRTTTNENITDALFQVSLTEEDVTQLSKESKRNKGFAEIHIPAFEIHHKTIGNENGKSHITTSAYEIRCHPDKSKIMKTLLAKCSEDGNTNFSFILYGLSQITTNETYRRQIVLQNNILANMAVVPIHGISKKGMKDKAQEKLIRTPGIRSIEVSHIIGENGKLLLLTSKKYIKNRLIEKRKRY